MCGRFTLTGQNRRELARRLGPDDDDSRDFRPRSNIALTDPHFIVTSKYEGRTVRVATRGLVTGATDSSCVSQFITPKLRRSRSVAASSYLHPRLLA